MYVRIYKPQLYYAPNLHKCSRFLRHSGNTNRKEKIYTVYADLVYFLGLLWKRAVEKCQVQHLRSHTAETCDIYLAKRQVKSRLQAQLIGWERTVTVAEWKE